MTNFADLNKSELRAACKAAGISYGKLNNDGMRDALALHAAQQAPAVADPSNPAELEKALANLDAQNTPEALAALGLYGRGGIEENAMCPHCGINHIRNGYQTAESLSDDGVKHTMKNEYICLACNGEWGPQVKARATKPDSHTGKGLKIEKGREERNGVKRPSIGGKCRAIWDALDALLAELEEGETVTSKMVQDLAADEGWNKNNASIEFYNWRKFNGFGKGR